MGLMSVVSLAIPVVSSVGVLLLDVGVLEPTSANVPLESRGGGPGGTASTFFFAISAKVGILDDGGLLTGVEGLELGFGPVGVGCLSCSFEGDGLGVDFGSPLFLLLGEGGFVGVDVGGGFEPPGVRSSAALLFFLLFAMVDKKRNEA